MARITVQRQCWQRWPRVLIAERRNDDGTVDERRYVPDGGTESEWKARCRDVLKLEAKARSDYELAMATMQGEFARAENLQAEVDGLEWQVEELESALNRASKFAANTSGTCPYDMFDFKAKDCDEECDDGYAECWRRYFERGDDSI